MILFYLLACIGMTLTVAQPTEIERCCCVYSDIRPCLPGFPRDRCQQNPNYHCDGDNDDDDGDDVVVVVTPSTPPTSTATLAPTLMPTTGPPTWDPDRCCCIWNEERACLRGFPIDRCREHQGWQCWRDLWTQKPRTPTPAPSPAPTPPPLVPANQTSCCCEDSGDDGQTCTPNTNTAECWQRGFQCSVAKIEVDPNYVLEVPPAAACGAACQARRAALEANFAYLSGSMDEVQVASSGFACGVKSGHVYVGPSWSKLPTQTDRSYTAVSCSVDEQIWAVDDQGFLYQYFSGKSEKTCEQLGLPGSFTDLGSTDVCGDSSGSGGSSGLSCTSNVNHASAKNTCANAGMRLCTHEELSNEETRGTGCSYDSRLVWTLDKCGSGKYTVARGSNGADSACIGQNSVANVRCCADVSYSASTDSGPFDGQFRRVDAASESLTSAKSCSQLGLPGSFTERGSTDVCGDSSGAGGSSGLSCTPDVSYSSAEGTCTAAGMRLCSLAELINQETRGTGCGYDSTLVWTRDECATNSHTVAKGAYGTQTECRTDDDASGADVRCCADATVNRFRSVAVRSADVVWAVKTDNTIVVREGWDSGDKANWEIIGGSLHSISVGSDGTTYGISPDDKPYKYSGSVSCSGWSPCEFVWGWTALEGTFQHISVGSSDHVYVVDSSGRLHSLNSDGDWTLALITYGGEKTERVSVASDGSLFGIVEGGSMYKSATTVVQGGAPSAVTLDTFSTDSTALDDFSTREIPWTVEDCRKRGQSRGAHSRLGRRGASSLFLQFQSLLSSELVTFLETYTDITGMSCGTQVELAWKSTGADVLGSSLLTALGLDDGVGDSRLGFTELLLNIVFDTSGPTLEQVTLVATPTMTISGVDVFSGETPVVIQWINGGRSTSMIGIQVTNLLTVFSSNSAVLSTISSVFPTSAQLELGYTTETVGVDDVPFADSYVTLFNSKWENCAAGDEEMEEGFTAGLSLELPCSDNNDLCDITSRFPDTTMWATFHVASDSTWDMAAGVSSAITIEDSFQINEARLYFNDGGDTKSGGFAITSSSFKGDVAGLEDIDLFGCIEFQQATSGWSLALAVGFEGTWNPTFLTRMYITDFYIGGTFTTTSPYISSFSLDVGEFKLCKGSGTDTCISGYCSLSLDLSDPSSATIAAGIDALDLATLLEVVVNKDLSLPGIFSDFAIEGADFNFQADPLDLSLSVQGLEFPAWNLFDSDATNKVNVDLAVSDSGFSGALDFVNPLSLAGGLVEITSSSSSSTGPQLSASYSGSTFAASIDAGGEFLGVSAELSAAISVSSSQTTLDLEINSCIFYLFGISFDLAFSLSTGAAAKNSDSYFSISGAVTIGSISDVAAYGLYKLRAALYNADALFWLPDSSITSLFSGLTLSSSEPECPDASSSTPSSYSCSNTFASIEKISFSFTGKLSAFEASFSVSVGACVAYNKVSFTLSISTDILGMIEDFVSEAWDSFVDYLEEEFASFFSDVGEAIEDVACTVCFFCGCKRRRSALPLPHNIRQQRIEQVKMSTQLPESRWKLELLDAAHRRHLHGSGAREWAREAIERSGLTQKLLQLGKQTPTQLSSNAINILREAGFLGDGAPPLRH